MASISRELTHFSSIRNAGVPLANQPGARIGGTYHPEHVNQAGVNVSARWEGSYYINRKAFTDAAGVKRTKDPDIIRLTAWSGKNSGGNGMAEQFARIMSPGLEISVDAHLQTFQGEVWQDDGTGNRSQVLKADGTVVMTKKLGFVVIPDSLIIGNESEKLVAMEIQQGLRPAQYNVRGSADNQTFLQLCQKKNAERYQIGSEKYGYAQVQMARGAQVAAYAGNASVTPEMVAAAVNPTDIASTLNAPLVEGCTLQQWRGAGLTDAQMINNPKFAAFAELLGTGNTNVNTAEAGVAF